MTAIGKFRDLSGSDRRFLIEAFLSLGLARLAILLAPFRRLTPLLGTVMAESPNEASNRERLAERVSRAVLTASRYTPWESKCLAQAMAAKMMLRRRAVCSTLYLGLAKGEDENLLAHAWLRCGRDILTGGPSQDQFTVIASFAERQQ